MTRPPFTLWYSVLSPGTSLQNLVDKMDVSPDMRVIDFRRMVVQQFQIPPFGAEVYKAPNVDLRDLHTARISMSDLGQALAMNVTLATIFGPQPAQRVLHLIVFRSDMPMPVLCCIRGTFTKLRLEVQRNQFVSELLVTIKESTDLNAPLERLELYKFSYRSQEELDKIVRTRGKGELLHEAQELHTAFSPLTEDVCVVVEIVEPKRTQNWDVVERALKRPKIAPSDFTPSVYAKMQLDPEERILDQRLPAKDKSQSRSSTDSVLDQDLPPVELLYAGFGQFLDTYRDKRYSDCVFGSPELWDSVEQFVEQMSRFYANERERQSAGLVALNNIFRSLFDSRQVVAPSSIDTTTSDGHYLFGNYKIPCFLVEFKNEAVCSSFPAVQLSSSYRQIVANVAEAKGDLVRRSRLPALGLTIVGPVVTFYAMAFVGSTVHYSLTPGLSCVFGAGGGDDRRALHAAFMAAFELIVQIETDARKLSDIDSPPPILVNHFFPDIHELPSIQTNTAIQVKITEILYRGSDRLLYRAESPGYDLDLVVKVTYRYSSELHQFCAERGHAPTLHAVKKFPGDVFVVAMDYIGADSGLDGSQEDRNELGRQLRRLVEEFHLAGYVHGDLRVPNIHCVKGRVMLLDFDWGGKVGEVFYPTWYLTSQLREGRDMRDLKITKEDDDRVLERTLMSIGCES